MTHQAGYYIIVYYKLYIVKLPFIPVKKRRNRLTLHLWTVVWGLTLTGWVINILERKAIIIDVIQLVVLSLPKSMLYKYTNAVHVITATQSNIHANILQNQMKYIRNHIRV